MNIGLLITLICSILIFILNAKIMIDAYKLQNYLIDELLEMKLQILKMNVSAFNSEIEKAIQKQEEEIKKAQKAQKAPKAEKTAKNRKKVENNNE